MTASQREGSILRNLLPRTLRYGRYWAAVEACHLVPLGGGSSTRGVLDAFERELPAWSGLIPSGANRLFPAAQANQAASNAQRVVGLLVFVFTHIGVLFQRKKVVLTPGLLC